MVKVYLRAELPFQIGSEVFDAIGPFMSIDDAMLYYRQVMVKSWEHCPDVRCESIYDPNESNVI